jgi:hypothetical protein
MELRYLYIASSNVRKDVEFHVKVLGAKLKWWFDKFDAQVASLSYGSGPELLLADHLEEGEVIYLYAVKDMKSALKELRAGGAKFEGKPFGIPNGPCMKGLSPAGLSIGIFVDERPGAMETSYADEGNDARIFL